MHVYSKCFSFKCHRDETKNVYSVNHISFHPMYGTFSTAGADGTGKKKKNQKLIRR